ncbi:hypothetical protein [Oceanospirillum sediminis]|uniref:Uncharacterized protein n=1 Tax=Oceanospirillum sediminis TaxID=2760088 RepID=A0A839IQ13_9GAMM|nr:hypothetical protein [Oceanospirillum sediminis]MBB1486537.1 hypothetical protein [Oceanospirillum sediminis]
MYYLSKFNEIYIEDLPYIVHPNEALRIIDEGDKPFAVYSYGYSLGDQARQKRELKDKIRSGDIILIRSTISLSSITWAESKSSSPFTTLEFQTRLTEFIQSGRKRPTHNIGKSPEEEGFLDQIVGATKQVANDFIKDQRAQQAEWFSEQGIVKFSDTQTGNQLTSEEIVSAYKENSPDTIPLSEGAEAIGAEKIQSIPGYSAIIPLVTTIASRGRNIKEPISLIDKKNPYNPDNVNKRSADFYSHYGNNPNRGTLSNTEARKFYLDQEKKIPSLLDKSLPISSQAKQAFNLRNEFRSDARERMQDRITADRLTREEPNLTFKEISSKTTKKLIQKGIEKPSEEQISKEIINSSQRSRQSVNKRLGL